MKNVFEFEVLNIINDFTCINDVEVSNIKNQSY